MPPVDKNDDAGPEPSADKPWQTAEAAAESAAAGAAADETTVEDSGYVITAGEPAAKTKTPRGLIAVSVVAILATVAAVAFGVLYAKQTANTDAALNEAADWQEKAQSTSSPASEEPSGAPAEDLPDCADLDPVEDADALCLGTPGGTALLPGEWGDIPPCDENGLPPAGEDSCWSIGEAPLPCDDPTIEYVDGQPVMTCPDD